MKFIFSLFIICTSLFLSHKVVAQSANSKFQQKLMKEAMKTNGFRLLDEGGMPNGTTKNVLGTDLTKFYKNKTYVFIGFVDDCASCPVAIRFAQRGQTPAYLPDEKVKITRHPSSDNPFAPKGDVTMIMNKTTFASTGEGMFVLMNKSYTKRYIYCMLYVKD